ncbi:MAG TPA: DUF1552 domain-containing protein [Candidatus Saccharimonadia bacterium]|nr:DUF1552 domain-containing protein [Candidatus Saccharimonadia bacterium]
MKTRMDRRTFLRASGVAIGLPFLDAMMPTSAAEVKKALEQPPRMVLIGQPLGMYGPNFFPEKAGRDYVPSRYLKNLEGIRDQFTVFSGMSHRYAAGHFAEVGLFTGVAPEFIRDKDIKNGISLDQEVASHIGNQTRFRCLNLGGGDVAWNKRGVRIPAEQRATQVFRKLFIAGTPEEEARELQRVKDGQSILDDVGDQIRAINRKVSTNDRERLDLFLTSVREAEQSLQQDEHWSTTPKPKVDYKIPTTDYGGPQLLERSRQWYDIVHLALQTDSTRMISLWIGTQERPEIDGVNLGHHDASHHGQDPGKLEQLALIEEAEIKVFGEFIEKMKATKEGDHALLDRTAVLYASNLGNSSSHDNNNLPIILAGGGFKHKGHLAYDTKNNMLLSNLYVRMLHHMDIEANSFGASNGIISEV